MVAVVLIVFDSESVRIKDDVIFTQLRCSNLNSVIALISGHSVDGSDNISISQRKIHHMIEFRDTINWCLKMNWV